MIIKKLIIQFLLAIVNVKATAAENQRCYVCIPNIGSSIADVIQIFPSGPSLPLCNGFHKDKKEYIRECPSSKYNGCLTQTNGTHITKTCSSIGVEDCKTANRIEYCYCKGQLCNAGNVPAEEARPPVTPGSGSGDDDEDTEPYMEGSGSSDESSRGSSLMPDDIGMEAPKTNPLPSSPKTVMSPSGNSAVPVYCSYAIFTFLIVTRFC